jgi:acyl-CoA thioester hydrolase
MYPAIDPSKSATTSTLRVRFCETDAMGIVHHSNYLVYFETGRVEWLRRRNIDYAAWVAKGVQTPVANAELTYRTPSRFDDLLSIETTLMRLRAVSLDYSYRVTREGTLIAEGSTRLACVDAQGKLARIPDHMRDALLAGESRA